MLPFVTAYGPHHRVQIDCSVDGAGRTKQSFKDECDINNIMEKFIRTGTLDFANEHEAHYSDCTGADFQTALNTVIATKAMFADMPAQVRNRFNNDPAQFLDFIQDENNREEAVKLGLLKAKPAEATAPAASAEGATGTAVAVPGAATTAT